MPPSVSRRSIIVQNAEARSYFGAFGTPASRVVLPRSCPACGTERRGQNALGLLARCSFRVRPRGATPFQRSGDPVPGCGFTQRVKRLRHIGLQFVCSLELGQRFVRFALR